MIRKYKRKNKLKTFFLLVLFLLFLYSIFKSFPICKEIFMSKAKEENFILKNISLEGNVNINEESFIKELPILKETPLLEIDIDLIKDAVHKNNWVETSNVYIKYPNSLYIEVKEKSPAAITKRNDKLVVVDKLGSELTDELKFDNLPTILSNKERISEIIDYMLTQPYFYENWSKAELINNRRWDIYLKDDIKVMLPEENIVNALEKLNDLRLQGNLLNFDIKTIDLRLDDKAIIQ